MTRRWAALFAVSAMVVAFSGPLAAQQEDIRELGWRAMAGDTQAFAELRAAADQGDARAQYSLGVLYDNGTGVPQDDAEAFLL